MEDSYTVHRRRKAAARKREKTPDPSSRGALRMDTSEDEDEERRARMERMAEEAERAEQKSKLLQQDAPKEPEKKRERKKDEEEQQQPPVRRKQIARNSANADDMVAIRAEVAAKSAGNSSKTREADAVVAKASDEQARPMKKSVEVGSKAEDGTARRERVKPEPGQIAKEKVVQDTSETSRETSATGETAAKATASVEVRKVERRLKRSKERDEKYCRSTDSSDVDEKNESTRRRTKSPEAARARLRKTSGKSRSGSDQEAQKDVERPSREKRLSSGRKLEDTDLPAKDTSAKPRSRPCSQTEDTEPEEPRVMKKSESFPGKSVEEASAKRPSVDLKKQIIPLSNDSLIEDFMRAQKQYLLRERSILDPELADEVQDSAEDSFPRRRKLLLNKEIQEYTENEREKVVQGTTQSSEATDERKSSWFSWLTFWRRKKKDKEDEGDKEETEETEVVEKKVEDEPKPAPKAEKVAAKLEEASEKITLLDFFRALRDVVSEFGAFVAQNPRETTIIRRMRNRCAADLILVIIYCGLGAFVFRFVEGAFENFYKCGVKRVKRDFLDSLWNYSHNLREEDWKSMARRKLMEFEEQLHTAHEAGVHSYSGQRSWTFLNAVSYCLTVITTIGYGHISPSTNTGRAITIIYAIFGIPMFLIILADFGKLFTRGIKFLWAFVRRLYYTGSCRKVRRTVPVQEVMKGVQLVYDLAKFRRPSQMNPEEIEEMQKQQAQQQQQQQTVLNLDANAQDSPGTPALSAFAIDDEFNLPISVAIFILLGYIFVGATLYYMWEEWGFFESFYFVFISMSTIGFGDYVPQHPIYMMCSIIYLVFGLALTSMCINVVQVMLSDSFRQASQKIGATIGFEVAEDDNSVKPAAPPPVEVADVHMSMKESESGEKIAPKAKQEDVDL